LIIIIDKTAVFLIYFFSLSFLHIGILMDSLAVLTLYWSNLQFPWCFLEQTSAFSSLSAPLILLCSMITWWNIWASTHLLWRCGLPVPKRETLLLGLLKWGFMS